MMRALALACLAMAWAAPALAHPHVWIDARATLRFDEGRITAIGMRWRFDEMFSDYVIGEYDRNTDGSFDQEETKLVRDEAFSALSDLGWLTHLRVAEVATPLPDYRDFAVAAEDGIVTYSFELPLPEPLDPAGKDVTLGVYDDSYYIDVVMEESEPLLFTGEPPEACRFEMVEDTRHPIYFGMVNPIVAEVRCAS